MYKDEKITNIRFTVVRHPLSRLVSCINKLIVKCKFDLNNILTYSPKNRLCVI